MKHTNTATVRAFNALNLEMKDTQHWSCDAPIWRIPSVLPSPVTAWLARHPEASEYSPFSRSGITTAALQKWHIRYAPSVRAVLAAPAEYKPAAKRAYRRHLGLVG